MARLYGDLLQTTGRRFYFDLASSPSVVLPQTGTITLFGRIPDATEPASTVRVPLTGTITLVSAAPSSPGHVVPIKGTIAVQSLQPSLLTEIIVTPALAAPVETAEPSYAPTLITQMTVIPTQGIISVQSRTPNVTEGGNIVFLQPSRGVITLSGLVPIFGFHPSAGVITLIGYAPTLALNSSRTIEPQAGVVSVNGDTPSLSIPFAWVDDEPASSSIWTDDPRV